MAQLGHSAYLLAYAALFIRARGQIKSQPIACIAPEFKHMVKHGRRNFENSGLIHL
jgi:hypothetical protein